MNIWPNSRAQDTLLKSERCRPPDFMFEIQLRWESGQFPANHNPIPRGVYMDDQMSFTKQTTLHSPVVNLRAGLDLESWLKNGFGCKKSTSLIGREAGTRLFKFTPRVGAS